MRAAIYITPARNSPLFQAASTWLGRDAFSGAATRQADPRIDPIVAEPARYGFHATLKAPFRLASEQQLPDLANALSAFAGNRQSFALGRITLARIGDFLALVPDHPSRSISVLESDVLRHFEPFRAALNDAEFARRRPEHLTERQRRYLAKWGYPYVLEEFRLHFTLTGSLQADDTALIEGMLSERLADFLGQPLAIDQLALFVEPEPGAPFTVHSHHPLRQPSLVERA